MNKFTLATLLCMAAVHADDHEGDMKGSMNSNECKMEFEEYSDANCMTEKKMEESKDDGDKKKDDMEMKVWTNKCLPYDAMKDKMYIDTKATEPKYLMHKCDAKSHSVMHYDDADCTKQTSGQLTKEMFWDQCTKKTKDDGTVTYYKMEMPKGSGAMAVKAAAAAVLAFAASQF